MPRKPVRGGDPGRGGGEAGWPGLRRGARVGRAGLGQQPLPPPPQGQWRARPADRPGCAGSLRAALAHGPLRNRQRRGFPRGGSLSSTITHSRAPPRLTKWRRPWIPRRPLPRPHFVRGETSVNMEYTSAEDASDQGSPASGSGARGDRVARRRRLPATLGRSVLFRLLWARREG